MKLSNQTYDILAFIGRIVLPALAVFYKSLGGIWGEAIPFPNEVSATIMAIDLLLNSLLGISSANFYKEQAKESANDFDVNDESIG